MEKNQQRKAGPEVLIMILLMIGLLLLFLATALMAFEGDRSSRGQYAIAAAISGGSLLLAIIKLSK